MKQTDKKKYLALGLFVAAIILSFLDLREIGGGIAIAGLIILMSNPHKSGNLFMFTFFAACLTVGTITDLPLHGFPPTLVFLTLIALVFNVRTWFFEKLFIYKVLWLEAAVIVVSAVSFAISAYLVHYDLRQWLTGGIPVFLFGLFSYIVYKDRDQARIMTANVETQIGHPAPDFTLPDQNNNPVHLKDILTTQHALLIFVRGDWCPTCHMMLRAYVKNKEKFAEKNIKIVGIGPDPLGVNHDIMSRIDDDSILLSDDEQETALLYTGGLQ